MDRPDGGRTADHSAANPAPVLDQDGGAPRSDHSSPEPATILDLLDGAFRRFAERPALRLWHDDGSRTTWTYRELDRRSRLAAWRLREQLKLNEGDRILTWSPSEPALPAVYFGAMRAGLILVPLDLRMSREAVQGIVASAEPRHLILGTGQDAPDPAAAGIADMPTTTVSDLVADPDAGMTAAGWEAQLGAWPRPAPSDVWDLIFTSGTTGAPKGVMVAHDNLVATLGAIDHVLPPLEHRIVSVLPLSHLFEQAIGLIYALSVGADILYVRSRNPRILFAALRTHRVTSMILVPQVLDLFWSAIEREADRAGRRVMFDRLRRLGRHLPYGLRRVLFRGVHARLGGGVRLFVSSGAFLPPALQQAWEDLGVVVVQGYGSSENGFGTCTTPEDHGLGTVGRPMPPVELAVAEDGEILFRGPTLFKGYWRDPAATARAIDPDGWYHTGDIGHLDPAGRLVLSGRTKDRIVLPNGFKVYPEDLENALRVAGLRDTVVVEPAPGRIEAVVLRSAADAQLADEGASAGLRDAADEPAAHAAARTGRSEPGRQGRQGRQGQQDRRARTGRPARPTADAEQAVVDAAVRRANAALGPQQRIAGWRFWPDDDFPRTHTLKIRREPIRDWIRGESALVGGAQPGAASPAGAEDASSGP